MNDANAAVITELDGHVLIVTLNRPQAHNAVNGDVALGLGTALAEADTNPEVRVVILTGAGEKTFCAGADLKAIARGEEMSPPGNRSLGLCRHGSAPNQQADHRSGQWDCPGRRD
ncbi:enoyl-CoA hydratase-related protein [Nocardioides marmoriginsengisoli]|uniref:enoyl-CoA hydratase-related protein n=1 Tax=Nocardioides marmoriginsengisoli TaxID=661483 RepID=UPI001C832BA1|nr:enoyl-CoA hydratase-related protein [Nocardioides marmoriginsengisoli]